MENEVAKKLYSHGSIWVVRTSTYTATDKLKAEDLEKNPDEIQDIFKLGRKYILPHDVRKAMAGMPGKVKALMDRFGEPFFLPAATFVPFKNTMLVKEGLGKLKADHLAVAQSVADQLPELKAEMINQYPVLANATWPTETEILNRFSVRWVVFEVNAVGAQEADPEDLIAAKAKFQQDLQQEYEDMKNEILKEGRVSIIKACDDIASKIFETGDKITKATLNKPVNVIEKYSQVAELFDLEDIKTKVAEVKAVISEADAQLIRSDWGTAKEFGDALLGLANDIDDLSGYSADGTVKRRIKLKKTA